MSLVSVQMRMLEVKATVPIPNSADITQGKLLVLFLFIYLKHVVPKVLSPSLHRL